MKAVFLDVHGVLNSGAWFADRTDADRALGSAGEIDPRAAMQVQYLCEVLDAGIVVTSDWRRRFRRTWFCDTFRARGLTATVLGMTPVLGGDRGGEIQAWLEENERTGRFDVDGFVILDDNDDMGRLKPWLVHVPWHLGYNDSQHPLAMGIARRPIRVPEEPTMEYLLDLVRLGGPPIAPAVSSFEVASDVFERLKAMVPIARGGSMSGSTFRITPKSSLPPGAIVPLDASGKPLPRPKKESHR